MSVIKRYVDRKHHKRPLNILLSASPGGGKSFLASQIAKEVGKDKGDFQELYIPSLTNSAELDQFFCDLGSPKNSAKVPFVLFDEVDIPLQGQDIFGNLLGPIWDGRIRNRGGKKDHTFTPAVFLFAGSGAFPALSEIGMARLARFGARPVTYQQYRDKWKEELEQRIADPSTPKKLKDFVDRMDIFICIPPTSRVLMKDADIAEEQLDIVCEMIKKYFLEVSTVEFSAAACLVEELNVNSSRRAVEIILQCSGCDGNTFCFKDLPVWVQSRYGNEQNVKSGMNVLVKFGGDGTS